MEPSQVFLRSSKVILKSNRKGKRNHCAETEVLAKIINSEKPGGRRQKMEGEQASRRAGQQALWIECTAVVWLWGASMLVLPRVWIHTDTITICGRADNSSLLSKSQLNCLLVLPLFLFRDKFLAGLCISRLYSCFPPGWLVICLKCHKILLGSLFSGVSDHHLQRQFQQEEFTTVDGKPRLTKAHQIPAGTFPGPYWIWEPASILYFA